MFNNFISYNIGFVITNMNGVLVDEEYDDGIFGKTQPFKIGNKAMLMDFDPHSIHDVAPFRVCCGTICEFFSFEELRIMMPKEVFEKFKELHEFNIGMDTSNNNGLLN